MLGSDVLSYVCRTGPRIWPAQGEGQDGSSSFPIQMLLTSMATEFDFSTVVGIASSTTPESSRLGQRVQGRLGGTTQL